MFSVNQRMNQSHSSFLILNDRVRPTETKSADSVILTPLATALLIDVSLDLSLVQIKCLYCLSSGGDTEMFSHVCSSQLCKYDMWYDVSYPETEMQDRLFFVNALPCVDHPR